MADWYLADYNAVAPLELTELLEGPFPSKREVAQAADFAEQSGYPVENPVAVKIELLKPEG